MTVFLAASPTGEDITSTVESAFASDERFKISNDKWLVSKRKVDTGFEAWSLLDKNAPQGAKGGSPMASVIVVELSNFYGYADASIWQWANAKKVVR